MLRSLGCFMSSLVRGGGGPLRDEGGDWGIMGRGRWTLEG